jgi:hypothetical protein
LARGKPAVGIGSTTRNGGHGSLPPDVKEEIRGRRSEERTPTCQYRSISGRRFPPHVAANPTEEHQPFRSWSTSTGTPAYSRLMTELTVTFLYRDWPLPGYCPRAATLDPRLLPPAPLPFGAAIAMHKRGSEGSSGERQDWAIEHEYSWRAVGCPPTGLPFYETRPERSL